MFFSIFSFLVKSNIWVASCAFFLTFQVAIALEEKVDLIISFFAFFAVLASYNFQRLYTLSENSVLMQFERWKWIYKNKKNILLIGLIASVFCSILFFTFNYKSQFLILFTFVLAVFYIKVPFFFAKGIRSLPLIKAGFVALSWSIVTVCLPFYSSESNKLFNAFLLFSEMFFFIFSITQPFDIRDLEVDKKTNITTIPMLLGISATKTISLVALFISVIFSIFISDRTYFYGVILSAVFSALLIIFTSQHKNEFYYSFFLESAMPIRILFVYLTVNFL